VILSGVDLSPMDQLCVAIKRELWSLPAAAANLPAGIDRMQYYDPRLSRGPVSRGIIAPFSLTEEGRISGFLAGELSPGIIVEWFELGSAPGVIEDDQPGVESLLRLFRNHLYRIGGDLYLDRSRPETRLRFLRGGPQDFQAISFVPQQVADGTALFLGLFPKYPILESLDY
jgi:hypothetical protein